jgi:hypothetical protein
MTTRLTAALMNDISSCTEQEMSVTEEEKAAIFQ